MVNCENRTKIWLLLRIAIGGFIVYAVISWTGFQKNVLHLDAGIQAPILLFIHAHFNCA